MCAILMGVSLRTENEQRTNGHACTARIREYPGEYKKLFPYPRYSLIRVRLYEHFHVPSQLTMMTFESQSYLCSPIQHLRLADHLLNIVFSQDRL